MPTPIATFKVELKAEARQDNTRAIRIRITKFRKHTYWNLGKYVLKDQWNPKAKRNLKNWVLKHDAADQINHAINKALKGLEKAADDLPAATAAEIKEAYAHKLNPAPEAPEPPAPVSFFTFADTFIAAAKETSFNTGLNYGYTVAEFKALAGEDTPYPALFTDHITRKYLKALKDKGNSPTTISNKLTDLQKIYRAGVKSKELPPLPDAPFAGIKITIPKQKKLRPTTEQIRQFIAYEPKNELQAIGRNTALLQYLLQGARVMEALTLEWANVQETYVEYLPQKKATRPKFVPRSRMLNDLLNQFPKEGRYVLPYIGEDYAAMPPINQLYRKKRVIQLVNKGLQEIGMALGFNIRLTSHMFRHAFADAIIAAGSSPHVAAALLGHSNPRTTENYIRDLRLEDISEVSLSIFDKLEGEHSGKQ